MLRALVRFLLGEDRFVTIEQLYEAVSSSPLNNLTEMGTDGYKGREEYLRLTNLQVRLFYRDTWWGDGRHVETIDMHAFAHRGGVWATFVNDEIYRLTQNTTNRNPESVSEDDKHHLWQILLKVRQSVNG